ncbi:hypothetical protein PSPO01_14318 [Paraphaeosphaeria sporulosa]
MKCRAGPKDFPRARPSSAQGFFQHLHANPEDGVVRVRKLLLDVQHFVLCTVTHAADALFGLWVVAQRTEHYTLCLDAGVVASFRTYIASRDPEKDKAPELSRDMQEATQSPLSRPSSQELPQRLFVLIMVPLNHDAVPRYFNIALALLARDYNGTWKLLAAILDGV